MDILRKLLVKLVNGNNVQLLLLAATVALALIGVLGRDDPICGPDCWPAM